MGRPRIYESVEELEQAIDDYFYPMVTTSTETKIGTITSEPAKSTERIKKPTVSGLALSIGFASKQSLYDYEKDERFSYPIKRALSMIEVYHEERLSDNNVTGAIFALKNMGWKDKTEVDNRFPEGIQVVMEKVDSVKPNYETK